MTVNDSVAFVTMDVSNLHVGTHALNVEGFTVDGIVRLLTSYEFVLSELPVVPDPVITHDGNMVTITPAELTQSADSLEIHPTYYYTMDGSEPDTASVRYNGPFEVVRNCVVKAKGFQEGFKDSEVDSLVVDWFKVGPIRFEQNGEYLTMSSPTEGATIFYSMKYTESGVTQTPTEPVHNGYVLHMPYSCTVDAYAMKDGWENSDTVHFVYTEPMADYAFDGTTLRVSGEGRVYPILDKLGNSASETICAIVWDVNTSLSEEMLKGIDNPNLLIYVKDASLAPVDRDNVVINGLAKNIRLVDQKEGNNNFYAPQAFTAEMISYTHDFQQETQVGVSRGWESIALPFDVQTIYHENQGVIAPFGNSDSSKHFWLRQLGPDGLQPATHIEANTPYIISMPNDTKNYLADYLLAGNVTFSAGNVIVPATEPKRMALADESIIMMPTMRSVGVSSEVYALNVGTVRSQYLEGSAFERDYRVVRPFEAYTVHRNQSPAPRFVPIKNMMDESTGIGSVECDTFTADQQWFTIDGRKLQGKPTQKGVYIQNGRKVIIP